MKKEQAKKTQLEKTKGDGSSALGSVKQAAKSVASYPKLVKLMSQKLKEAIHKAAAKAIKPAIVYLIKMNCKKIILGCTELPIAIFAFKSFENVKSSKVFLDPNLILAHSAMVKHKN